MFASTISGKSGPRWSRMARTRSTSSLRRVRPTFLLLRVDAPVPIVAGVTEQRRQRELEVDAARIAGHAGVMAAEQPPERRPLPASLQIPQRDVDRGDRQRRVAAPAAVMKRPPHRVPELLD